jgi:hypothetical protein
MVSPRKVAVGLGAAWLLAFILCLPPLFLVAPYSYNAGLAGCAPDFGLGDGAIWYSAIYTLLTFLLPAALILGCNIKVRHAQTTITMPERSNQLVGNSCFLKFIATWRVLLSDFTIGAIT